jgi:hypothetical protein
MVCAKQHTIKIQIFSAYYRISYSPINPFGIQSVILSVAVFQPLSIQTPELPTSIMRMLQALDGLWL